MKENHQVPAIRFTGFADPWEQRKLKSVAAFDKGRGYSKSDLQDSGTPIILYGRLYTRYEVRINEVDTYANPRPGSLYSTGKEVVVPASGETAEDIAIAAAVEKSGVLLGGDLNVIYPLDHIEPVFLALAISNGAPHQDMAKRAQGKSVVHLHNTDLQEINFFYPSIDEQRKIDAYFLTLDNLITLHQRKYDKLVTTKKSMLEKMFPREGASVPEIRFAGFTDPWEQRKVGDLIEDYVERTTIQNQYPVLTSSQQQGIILQEDYFADRQVTTNDNIGYFVLPQGYFTYRSRSDTDVFVFNRNTLIDKGIISYYYPVFRPKHCDSNFLLRRLNHGIRKQLAMAAEGTGQKVLSHSKFKNMVVDIPCYAEQTAIGELLETLEHLITLHQRKLEKLKKVKQAMLERMFV